METVDVSLESIRLRERVRMARLLANRRPMTEEQWVAQVDLHRSVHPWVPKKAIEAASGRRQ